MPCLDGGPDNYHESELEERLDLATRVACELGQVLKLAGRPLAITSEAKAWLDEHQKQDALRKKQGLLAHILDRADTAPYGSYFTIALSKEEQDLLRSIINDDLGS